MISVVTGASRGAGKGIAIALGAAGGTVYVTGRSTARSDSPFGGTVSETVGLITQAGGIGIAVFLDHTDDDAVAALFTRIRNEHGRLDILVNNAAKLATPTGAAGLWDSRNPLRHSAAPGNVHLLEPLLSHVDT
jgi:NAD(P)-dependent dehydrogenase (short-subunit alcohol dehydrogenase family)